MFRHFRPGAVITTATVLVASHSPASAQDVGQRVRVTTATGTMTGEVTETSAEGFDMAVDGGGRRTVANSGVQRLERSLGDRINRTEGFLVGAVIGATVGASLSDGTTDLLGGAARVMGGVTLGISLGLVGLLAGHLITVEQWERIPNATGPATFSPLIDLRLGNLGRSGMVLGARMSF